MAQTFNIAGFVSSIDIQPDEYLLPLHEVVVNAIQSIEDLPNPADGIISIKVLRGQQLTIKDGFEQPYKPILGFEVQDNGVGFISQRFQAFNDAFTDLNKKKGCKGIGRYTVLACFGSMDISSIYVEKNKWLNRNFRFDVVNGVEPKPESKIIGPNSQKLETVVKLNNLKPSFSRFIQGKRIELQDIANEIIQHCLLYFIANNIPQIRIYNENEQNNSLIINDIYRSVVKFDHAAKPLKIKGATKPFLLNYVRNYDDKSHSFHLCANKREVGKKTTVSNYIPSFVQCLNDEDAKKYYVSIYITSDFLDSKANNQRNKFSIPLKESDKNSFDEISIESLLKEVSEDVKEQYTEFILNAEKEKNDRIRSYILDPKNPRLAYKHLLSVENIFEDIPANATDERLESELHQKVFHLEQKRAKAFERAFNKKKYDKKDFSEIIHTVLKEEAAFSADKLADLVVRRKAVLKLFRKYLDWRSNNNYMLEEDLHNIIFTMGAESDVMPRNYHNLWLLDERLSFYSYTTSDRQLRTNNHLSSDSQKETDLLIYDFPWAYSDNPNKINSIVVFEFKRPGRDMNTVKDKKLDSQVEEYFELLMENNSKSDKGRLLNIEDNTPKFGYIICELTKDLIEYNVKHNYFKKTPNNTLFKINTELNQYFEVMSYETMLEFAEKRHDAFFQALGIDNL